MVFIHSKLRNSLTLKSVDKLTYMKSNLSNFYDYDVLDYGYETDDCESE